MEIIMTEQPKQKKPRRAPQPINIGDVFVRLTILSDRIMDNDYKKRMCRCLCGTEKLVMEAHIVSGNTQSCGCLAKEGVKIRSENRKPRKKGQNHFACSGCGQPCLHKSSYCSACRRVPCRHCKEPFMMTVMGDATCAHCKKAKSRPSRGEW